MLRSVCIAGALFGFVAMFSGCSSQLDATDVQTAQSSLEKARDLAKAGSCGEAIPLLDESLGAGGLGPDQYAEALLYRAWCRAETGKVDEAKQDFSQAEQGSPDPALVHFVTGVMLEAEGDSKAAKQAFAKAKRLDASLKR